MSVEAIAWVLNHAPVQSPVSKLVLVALANHAHPDGSASFPSVATICRYTCLSERSVRQHLDALESSGVIRRCDQSIVAAYIKRTDRRPVGYDIMINEVHAMHPAPERGAGDAVDGVQEIPERGAGDAPKPSNKPSPEPLVSFFSQLLKETTPSGVSIQAPNPSWGKAINRLLDGGATEDQIRHMMRCAMSDPWWRKNIRNPMKLEQHWERLVVEKSAQTPLPASQIDDGRFLAAMTTVLNFHRMGRSPESIQEFIEGYPEYKEVLLEHWRSAAS